MQTKRKFNLGLIGAVILSMADEALILVLILLVLSQLGIAIPFWVFLTMALVFIAITFLIYFLVRKNPQLGFENMLGQSGLAIEPIGRSGTVKIGENYGLQVVKTAKSKPELR